MDNVQGYEIREAITFEGNRGIALGVNPTAPSPFVTWQFTEENSSRDYYWGHYFSSEKSARADFTARVKDYREGMAVKEKPSITAQLKKAPHRPEPAREPKAKGHGDR